MSTQIQITPETGITIGTTAIDSGVDGRVLFQQGSVVQQDANFTFNNTQKRLTLKASGTTATDIPFVIRNSADTADLFSVRGDNLTFVNNKLQVGSYLNGNTKVSISGTDNIISYFGGGNASSRVIYAEYTASLINNSAVGHFFNRVGNGSASGNIHNAIIASLDSGNANITARGINCSVTTAGTNIGGRFSASGGVNNYAIIAASGNVGIGQIAPTARLDVLAQGALSTDIAFRVRNSGDTANVFSIAGNGFTNFLYGQAISLNLGGTPGASTGSPYLTIYNGGSTSHSFVEMSNNSFSHQIDRFCNIITNGGGASTNASGSIVLGPGQIPNQRNFQLTVAALTAISQGTNDSGFAQSGADTSGNNAMYTNYIGRNWILGGTTQGTGTRKIVLNNGTAPSTNLTDAFQQYSADIVAGNAAPHFRTEAGDVIKLYKETTGITSETFVANTSGIADDSATFGGYTMGQVVAALKAQGLLA